MKRCSSTNSDSSVEPMETSSSNKTGASEVNVSAIAKSNESDNVDSDEAAEDSHNDVIRRNNVRKMMDDILKRFLPGSTHLNNNNNNNVKIESAPSPPSNQTSSQQLNQSGNNNSSESVKYVCPICDVISTTPHEFSVHIRGHNNDSSDDNQSYTCRICSKVSYLFFFLFTRDEF